MSPSSGLIVSDILDAVSPVGRCRDANKETKITKEYHDNHYYYKTVDNVDLSLLECGSGSRSHDIDKIN